MFVVIWRGWGIALIFIPLLTLFFASLIVHSFPMSEEKGFLVYLFFLTTMSFGIYKLGKRLNTRFADPSMKQRHSLFLIPFEFWGVIWGVICGLGLVLLLFAKL